jgi:hypothetical protein
MTSPRLEFALDNLSSSDWRAFEKFASQFLVSEFPTLRTTASASGDKGRDGEVFRLDDVPRTVFQYSVTADWTAKIKDTVSKIRANFPSVSRLIYCTNQEIGARVDQLREEYWKEFKLQIDLRDRNWFVEREGESPARGVASDELCKLIVDPILQKKNLVNHITTPISHAESKVALLQLVLNDRDRRSDQSITKTSFETLVQAAVIGTSSESTLTKNEICETVAQMLPSADSRQVRRLASSALERLSRKNGPIKHLRKEKRFHLSYESGTEWQAGAAEFLLEQEELDRDLAAALYGVDGALDDDTAALMGEAKKLRTGLERLLLQRGETFASSVIEERVADVSTREIAERLAALELAMRVTSEQAANAILTVLGSPSDRTRRYLERVLNAYTLMAFLQQTPDVQKVLSRMFDGAEIWLDTSAVLPLIGELALDEDEPRPFTALLRAARESGLHLYVTRGVIDEIDHHLDNCLKYLALGSDWRGRVPYVFSAFIYSGQPDAEFSEWIADFKGSHRPELDIEESLTSMFGIERRDLKEFSDAADVALRGAVQNHWFEAHSKRRKERTVALGVIDKLVAHDVENVVGVIEHRRRSKASPLGYSAWWLTLDSTAFKLQSWLKDQLGSDAPHSPVISPDYFSQMLRFGPLRRDAATQNVSTLPVSVEIRRFENAPKELLKIAREARDRYSEYGERRIRREVRDALDRVRTATVSSSSTLSAVDDELVDEVD